MCTLLGSLAAAFPLAPLLGAAPDGQRAINLGPASAFSWGWLKGQARALAGKPYQAPAARAVNAADYDQSVRLTYGEAERLAGAVRLFPTTRNVAENVVAIHLVEQGKARRVESTAGLFVGGQAADPAGFRIMQDTAGASDWLAFLGGTYFRSPGVGGQYGLSARAIAVNIGLQQAEEFPAFTQFWIERLGRDAWRIHGLIDGPSLTGAFALDSALRDWGVEQQVQLALFLRKDVARLGIAPITSMYWYDQNGAGGRPDWRPEIHDSDGLAIAMANGEHVWRPLINPQRAQVNAFQAGSVRGFGLLQRDRDFANYRDDSAFYDRRPNLWVEPQGDWGPGAVMLYEMPTAGETQDNIGAYWVSTRPARKGSTVETAYRLRWMMGEPGGTASARLVDQFVGPAGIPGAPPTAGAHKYVFDFRGDSLAGLTRESGVEIVTNLPSSAIIHAAAYPVVGQDRLWRAMVDVRENKLTMQEFRISLRRGADALSETVIQPVM